MEWFLIIMTSIVACLLLLSSIYILALYCHPDDKGFGSSTYCKILVVLGLAFSWAQLLLLPLDIANSREGGGDLNMQLCWQIIYIGILTLLSFLIPSAIVFYESDEEKSIGSRLLETFATTFCIILFFGLIVFLSYYFWRFADFPLILATKQISDSTLQDSSNFLDLVAFKTESQKNKNIEIEFEVDFYVFLMGLFSFCGYFFFVIFGGIGLSTLPLDLIQSFRHRPKPRKTQEAKQLKQSYQQRTQQLIELGREIAEKEKELKNSQDGWWKKRRGNGKLQRQIKIFNAAVTQLTEEYDVFKLEINIVASNPIVYYMKLLVGILGIFISILWWFHILFSMVLTSDGFEYYTFLNQTLIYLENWHANFISITILSVFSIYFLWCVQKGNFKVGLRIPFLMTIHPMVIDETYMNSFLFNIWIIMLCSVSLTHFTSTAFAQYSRFSQMDQIWRAQVQYLQFFKYFFTNKVFEISILVISILGLFFVIFTTFKQSQQQYEIEQRKHQLTQNFNKKYDIELQEMLIKKDNKQK